MNMYKCICIYDVKCVCTYKCGKIPTKKTYKHGVQVCSIFSQNVHIHEIAQRLEYKDDAYNKRAPFLTHAIIYILLTRYYMGQL